MVAVPSVSICKILFAFLTLTTVSISTLLNIFEPYLPVGIRKSFRYGKFSISEEYPLVRTLEVPKSYFRHFYALAVLVYPLFFSEVISAYVFDNDVKTWVISLLNFFCGTDRVPNVSKTHVFLAVTLMMLQAGRRFYDTHFVSVFSKKATMNFSHYLLGMIYYPAVMLIILSEAPAFAPNPVGKHSFNDTEFEITQAIHEETAPVGFMGVGLVEIVAVVVFLWAWYHQHVATVILANLRKNAKGDVVSQSYKIPEGDLFNYVSSPHSSTEIIMYTALTCLLRKNTGWWYLYVFVLSNQVETILLSHWWYQKNFKEFPKQRRALIPFIY